MDLSQSSSETADAADENKGSLLIPPNPAILAQQPRGSILINRNDASCVTPSTANSLKSPAGASSVLTNVKNAFLFGETARPRQPGPPAAVFNNRNRASSASSTASTASSGSYSGMAPQSVPGRRRAPSPSVSFAPLPQVPNLERTRSITLGVAARSNMLKTQGNAAGKMGSQSGAALPRKDGMRGYLMMTDEEWEYYKKEKADAAQNHQNPPEIHHLVRDSGKKLWQKARSLSSTSSKSSPSPTARARTLDPAADSASTTSSGKFSSPPDSLNDQSGDSNLVGGANSRGRLGLFGRSGSSSSSPNAEIPEYAIDESSEIGSIAEEDEDAVEDEDEKDRILPLQNRYLNTDGFKPRAQSSSAVSDGQSSTGESSYNSNEDEEDEPPVNLPAYLQKDMGAERRHYMHEHESAAAGGGQTRYHSNSGTATPTAAAFDHERHHLHMPPMSQSPSNGELHQNHLHHAHITKHLLDMNLGGAPDGVGYVAGEGDATPRMRGSPKSASMSMSRVSEDTI